VLVKRALFLLNAAFSYTRSRKERVLENESLKRCKTQEVTADYKTLR
jgi:hypothetical protein